MSQLIEDLSKQLNDISKSLRAIRIQVILLALKDCKQKTASVVVLENQLSGLLAQHNKNIPLIEDVLDQLECFIHIKPQHHQFAQQTNAPRSTTEITQCFSNFDKT